MLLPLLKCARSAERELTPGPVYGLEGQRFEPVTIHVAEPFDQPLRRYGLEQLCQVVGRPLHFTRHPEATIYYGGNPRLGRKADVWIWADPERNWATVQPALSVVEGIPVLHHDRPPPTPIHGNRVEFDLGLATAYWLTLASETAATPRDAHGRVRAASSVLGRAELISNPPVNAYGRLLARMLPPVGVRKCVPRWPYGKRYAVLMTHDVDGPERRPIGRALLGELLRPKTLARRQAYYALRAEIRAAGTYQSLIARPERRREWDFDTRCALEKTRGLRSAYYFGAINRAQGHPCDVDYDVRLPRYKRLMSQLCAEGFEVGLHAGYSTQEGRTPGRVQVAQIEGLVGRSIHGVRHHYLQINHADPMRTLFEHADAGLLYDTSIGFNEAAGFRAGTALPFTPFHPDLGTARDFAELPMTLADMHLPKRDDDAAVATVIRHLETVREIGGMAVLNWHVGHWHRDTAWRASYIAACDFLAHDAAVWTPLPSEAARWWIERQGIWNRNEMETAPVSRSAPLAPPKVKRRAAPEVLACGILPNKTSGSSTRFGLRPSSLPGEKPRKRSPV